MILVGSIFQKALCSLRKDMSRELSHEYDKLLHLLTYMIFIFNTDWEYRLQEFYV